MIIDFLRDLKISYSFYNFFKKSELEHNISIYKQIGLAKKYYNSISSIDFKNVPHPIENKTSNLVDEFSKNDFFKTLSESSRQSLMDFDNNGYSIVSGLFSSEEVDQVNDEVDRLIKTQKVQFKYINKIMFAFKKSEILKKMATKKPLLEFLEILVRRKPVLFQSINFIHGSEQATHSDSIHMTTYPLGNLIAVWIALEDITIEQGALHYYPKSHTQPYFLNEAFNNKGNWLRLGKKTYSDYEKELAQRITKMNLKKEVFAAKKGDLLIWHANLLHGGEPHVNKKKTRKSMVLHFFTEGVVSYHEFTQRPALMKKKLTMSIVLKNVSKIYGQQKAVNSISFEIGKGEIVGFLGPNGAGKSTTMKMITSYLPATSGQILVENLNVQTDSLSIRKLIGYLPENNPLYIDMYVKEYLSFVSEIHELKNKDKIIQEVIQTVGLQKEQHKKIGALSKGYKQRVGIAQAIIHNPKVLILDEPTSGLDPNQIIEIRELIQNLGKDRTILMSTHILQEVEAICSRIMIINQGELVANESKESIKKTGQTIDQLFTKLTTPLK